ncbi:hypothetical protein H6P81_008277 [Aristolochia fimbriata]|uniref:DNA mismatch repair proteins mutS family domain-containing protein n=1 Tax=Aristolochia fimbriata TaxID=158543 RepID=A0AAV7F736_ARIFI|nr:hypothetical protein H6P81_008277 [Aristolochia fimbriata]
MFSAPFGGSAIAVTSPICTRFSKIKVRAYLQSNRNEASEKSAVLLRTLRVLEWDKLCDSVAAYAGTTVGREETKSKLWSMHVSYEESMNLLTETNAAVEMIKYGASGMDFSGLDLALVKSAVDRASRSLHMNGVQALAVANLLQLADVLQSSVKAAVKEDADWYSRFLPLSEIIMEFVVNNGLVKLIQKIIDEDGSVKDSASSELKRSRDQVRVLEKRLLQLLDNLVRSESSEKSSLEVININGRWCIQSAIDQSTTFTGLLLSSSPRGQSLMEPVSAVPLNDELQQARALVAKAEESVLSRLTDKIRASFDDIKNLLHAMTQLDVVTARAKYSLDFGGTCPDIYYLGDKIESVTSNGISLKNIELSDEDSSSANLKNWALYLRKSFHPLLLNQHRESLKKFRKDVNDAVSEKRRRRLQGGSVVSTRDLDAHLAALKTKVIELEGSHPVPVDFLISKKTKAVVITGPNTGGKTISLKTVGLAALMAKSGLYVLASEPVRIPWFDFVFADVGDEQSLAQSLSTFSGHLKQISAILAESTRESLVLLDEVGAGTNPLEGAALGMSLLEAFAESGSLLTLATTHHGELKALKYSNRAFENACVEFDEEDLKPTYKILWGIPGRSNAINIAERLGLPGNILDGARKLYGVASAELNGVIIEMERYKQSFHQHAQDAQKHLKLSRELHERLLMTKQKITEHSAIQRYRKMREISESAAQARSALHNTLREFRARHAQPSNSIQIPNEIEKRTANNSPGFVDHPRPLPSEKKIKIPSVGDTVHVRSLRKTAAVVKLRSAWCSLWKQPKLSSGPLACHTYCDKGQTEHMHMHKFLMLGPGLDLQKTDDICKL